jgi:hypothetical protein
MGWRAGGHGVLIHFYDQRPALRGPEMVGEARQNNMIRIGGGGQPDRHTQH